MRARYLVDDTLRGFLARIDEAGATDRALRWYPGVLEKFRPTFRMLSLEVHSDVFDVCAELADFMNQVLEAVRADDQMKKWAVEGAEAIGQQLGLGSLAPIVRILVKSRPGVV